MYLLLILCFSCQAQLMNSCANSLQVGEFHLRILAGDRSLETGLQERVSNHLRRLWSKAMVVSAEGKGLAMTRSGIRQEEDCKGTTVEVSKAIRRCQNRGWVTAAGQAPTEPVYGRGGIRHERWPELAKEAVKRNMGT